MHMALPLQSKRWAYEGEMRTRCCLLHASMCVSVSVCELAFVCSAFHRTHSGNVFDSDTIPSAKCAQVCARDEMRAVSHPNEIPEISAHARSQKTPHAKTPTGNYFIEASYTRTHAIRADVGRVWRVLFHDANVSPADEVDWGGKTSHRIKYQIPLTRNMRALTHKIHAIYGRCSWGIYFERVWSRKYTFADGDRLSNYRNANIYQFHGMRRRQLHFTSPGTWTMAFTECSSSASSVEKAKPNRCSSLHNGRFYWCLACPCLPLP